MKRLLALLTLFSASMYAKDIQVNFEIRNHEQFPIFVRLIQKGFRTVDQTDNYKLSFTPATIGQLTLVNGKSGGAIDSWASGFDWSRPTYVEIAYFKNKQFISQLYAVPAYRTVYVAFENGLLRPQKGKGFGKFTQSGHPLNENIKAGDLVKLNAQQIKNLFDSIEQESQEAVRVLQQYALELKNEQQTDNEDKDISEEALRERYLKLRKFIDERNVPYDIYEKYE